MRVGDVFEGGAVVINNSHDTKDVSVSCTASGVRADTLKPALLSLSPGKAGPVHYRFTAGSMGTATFAVKAVSSSCEDALRWTIPVQAPLMSEAAASYGSTTDSSVVERIRIPTNIEPDTGEVRVTVASTAMVGLAGATSYLFDYPYGCLEQRLSAALPMIMGRGMMHNFDLQIPDMPDSREVVRKTLAAMQTFQCDSGGFSYWSDGKTPWPYLSAFACYALVQAERHGYDVDSVILGKGLRYLGRVLDGKVPFPAYKRYAWNATRALGVYTLALAGKPRRDLMDAMFKERNALGAFSKAYLLRALVASGGDKRQREILRRDLMNEAKVSANQVHYEEPDEPDWYWVFRSNVRITALVLQALMESGQQDDLQAGVVRWLMSQQKTGRWRTTQENLYAVEALSTYFSKREQQLPDFRAQVTINNRKPLDQAFKGRKSNTAACSIPIKSLETGEHPVHFSKNGAGRMYYGLQMRYFPIEQGPARDEGLSLSKTFERVNGDSNASPVWKIGTTVRVTVTIATTQERQFVVIEDPLPAGFEVINTSFATTARWYSDEDEYSNDWDLWNISTHREMYDDRVVFFANSIPAGVHRVTYLARATSIGKFLTPPTRAEGMYEPEVFGRTTSTVVEVVP